MIHHPESHEVTVREWAVKACGGDHCAAALLDVLLRHHDARVKVARSMIPDILWHMEAGDEGPVLPVGQVPMPLSAAQKELCGLFAERTIRKAFRNLLARRYIVAVQPGGSRKLNRIRRFLVQEQILNAWIAENYPFPVVQTSESAESKPARGKKKTPSKNRG